MRTLERELSAKRNEIRQAKMEKEDVKRQLDVITHDLTELRIDSASTQSQQLINFQEQVLSKHPQYDLLVVTK